MINASATAHLARTVYTDRRRIAVITFVCTALAGTYATFAPPWYEAQISVVPSTPPKGSSLGGMAAAALADVPVDLNMGSSSDAERIQAVLNSRSVTDAVIEKFDLTKRYDVKYIDDARVALWQHCSTRLERKPGVVTVTCEDRDPAIVQQMTEYFAEDGNVVFRRVSASSAGEERRFLEKRVAETQAAVEAASRKLRDFEEQHKLIDLPEQSKAVVTALAKMKGELLSKQIELSYLNRFSSSDEATTQQLRQQLSVMESKMRSLESDDSDVPSSSSTGTSRTKKTTQSDLFPTAMSVPKLRFELEELYRDQKIQETLFAMLTQRYEMAKVNEARDTSTLQVIDHAVVPNRKSRPHRAKIVLGGFVIGIALALLSLLGLARVFAPNSLDRESA